MDAIGFSYFQGEWAFFASVNGIAVGRAHSGPGGRLRALLDLAAYREHFDKLEKAFDDHATEIEQAAQDAHEIKISLTKEGIIQYHLRMNCEGPAYPEPETLDEIIYRLHNSRQP